MSTARRLDVEWDRGADWAIILARRTRSGDVLPAVEPCRWEVRAVDAMSSSPPLLTLDGVVRADGRVRFDAAREQIEGLDGEHYEYRVAWTDREGPRSVLLRGYTTIIDNVGGTG